MFKKKLLLVNEFYIFADTDVTNDFDLSPEEAKGVQVNGDDEVAPHRINLINWDPVGYFKYRSLWTEELYLQCSAISDVVIVVFFGLWMLYLILLLSIDTWCKMLMGGYSLTFNSLR